MHVLAADPGCPLCQGDGIDYRNDLIVEACPKCRSFNPGKASAGRVAKVEKSKKPKKEKADK